MPPRLPTEYPASRRKEVSTDSQNGRMEGRSSTLVFSWVTKASPGRWLVLPAFIPWQVHVENWDSFPCTSRTFRCEIHASWRSIDRWESVMLRSGARMGLYETLLSDSHRARTSNFPASTFSSWHWKRYMTPRALRSRIAIHIFSGRRH